MPYQTKVLLIAGGQGTRLWPKSRRSTPKQFMTLGSSRTLFQQALDRVHAVLPHSDVFVVAPHEYKALITSQAPNLDPSQLILEPMAHGTTAAVMYSLLHLQAMGLQDTDVLVMLPADAYIGNEEAFGQGLQTAIQAAKANSRIVTLGVRPSFPATAYGYMRIRDEGGQGDERGEEGLSDSRKQKDGAVQVEQFVEKPDSATAKVYFEDPRYFWNAGIFAWTATTLMNLFALYQPVLLDALKWAQSQFSNLAAEQWAQWYATLPQSVIETAIIEHAQNIWMVPARFDWADLGTWPELLSHFELTDPNSPVFHIETKNSLALSDNGLVGLLGVENVLVIRSGDAVFVCHREFEQEIKRYLAELEKSGYGRYL